MRTSPTDPPATEKIGSQRLSRRERLRGRASIRNAFRMSHPDIAARGARLLVTDNGLDCNRLLVSTRRGFPSAVARNKARRQYREAYRQMKNEVAGGHDLIFLVYPGARDGSAARGQVRSLVERAGLLRADSSA